MDVLLTHGYFLKEDALEQKIMRPYPPLGLLYLSAYLNQHDFSVKVFDTTFSDYDALQQELLRSKPKVIAIYANLITKVNNIRLMQWVRSRPELAQSKLVMGGPDVTYNYENYLKWGAHFIVIGEGEQTLLELSESLIREESYAHITGLAYSESGVVVKTPAREKIKNIDALPEPDRDAIDLNNYLQVWKEFHGSSTLNISTQRGCPYTCKWCSTAVYGQSYRRRSPVLVANEIEGLLSTYSPDSLWFVDDVFTVNHRWIKELHHEFVVRKINIPFEIITRAERLNDTVLTQLQEMGCSKIWIGAESGSQRIIDEMDRRVDINLVKDMVIKTKSYGIQTGTFIMVGYPTETEEDIELSVQHLKDSSPDNFTITVAYPIKGTALYNQVQNDFTAPLKWENSTDREIDFKRTFSRKYYDYAVRYIVNEVGAYQERERDNADMVKVLKMKFKSHVSWVFMRLSK